MPQTMLFSERLFASRPSAGRRARLRVQAAAAGGSGAGARKGLPPANAATVAMRGGAEASTSTSSEPRDRPLILGGTTVEDEALGAALQTLAASQAGALPPRRLVYECADVLQAAYDRCGEVTEDYGRTFYMATQLMTEQRRKAIWAIYGAPQPAPAPRARSQPLAHAQPPVWCRRTDELVDGPNSPYITPAALDRWKERLEAVFAGRPFDLLDAALTDTVASFPVDITPFYDMIDGMRMDLVKTRYATFDELYEYCYRVAGTVALMSVPIMGIAADYEGPTEPVYRAALGLGMANQLTNILRDVGEDARTRGRVYIPQEDLTAFGISDAEVVNGTLAPPGGPVDPRWQAMMRFQINRARNYFKEAEVGVSGLDKSARWPVWAALILYSKILDSIEANGYDNFNVRAYVPTHKKLLLLPAAFYQAMTVPTLGRA